MIYIGIDPGPDYVAWAYIQEAEGKIWLAHGKEKPENHYVSGFDHVGIEVLPEYGFMRSPLIRTGYTIGKMMMVYPTIKEITRIAVRKCLTGRGSHITDADIRCALIEIYGDPGKKKNPGPTYGFKRDTWQALAVAHTLKMMVENNDKIPKIG